MTVNKISFLYFQEFEIISEIISRPRSTFDTSSCKRCKRERFVDLLFLFSEKLNFSLNNLETKDENWCNQMKYYLQMMTCTNLMFCFQSIFGNALMVGILDCTRNRKEDLVTADW